jgi:hypothetical protein
MVYSESWVTPCHRSTRAAHAAQKELDRSLAEREAARNIAAVQLERVRMQMAENIRPLHYAMSVVIHAVRALGTQLSLSWGCTVFGRDFAEIVFAPPGDPHVVLIDESKLVERYSTTIFEHTLGPEGLARLEADPADRRMWVECWLSLQPQLQAIETIVTTKAHLQEPVQLAELEKMFKTSLGREWKKVYGSPGTVQCLVVAWLRQWCAPYQASWCVYIS